MSLAIARANAFLLLVSTALAGCSRGGAAVDAGGARSAASEADATATTVDVTKSAEGGAPATASEKADEPEPTFDEIAAVLFADRAAAPSACNTTMPADARIRCLYDERYRGDAKATSIAHELYVKWRIVAGVEAAHTMDGGYRGMIQIVPAVPVGENRKHLEWVAGALADFDRFFTELEAFRVSKGANANAVASAAKPYRFRPIMLRFMRSQAPARTPAAYARDWTVAYNFVGTLNISADAVRETMFHEIFHLNDAAHHVQGREWSLSALEPMFDVAVKKCGTNIPCLGPYTPNDTIVRGGTYYAYQPGNGVREYAAELALRYYREQRAALRNLSPRPKPFKCGPPENAAAWTKMKDEFFGGVDAVPSCP